MPRGPVVEALPVGTLTTFWLGGSLHRDPKDGPARHYSDGTRSWSEYWVNGLLHRPSSQGPAFIYSHFEGQEIAGEEYVEHGVWHRPAALGPAMRHVDRTGNVTRAAYYRRGERHRDPQEGPVWCGIEQNEYVEEYVEHGCLHRGEDEGPALFRRHLLTGAVTREEFYHHGQSHRAAGPAIVIRDIMGFPIYEAWFREGVMHRDPAAGPAHITRDSETGHRREVYVADGCAHRDPSDGPAVIVYDAAGHVIEHEYWRANVPVAPPGIRAAEAKADV